MVEAGVHTKAVELDFVQPFLALRRGVDQPGELRPNPLRQLGGGMTMWCRSRHNGMKTWL